uniref:Glycerol-3-phosphate dehydrogenase NAD-dependent N-terminal domain-containing protein n=1 Tax=Trichobilharzia regenti TaxID=157069 RepID=A0AA85JE00_TRIRE|nr:unnamed protein product [Trichobilharzia regenti]
MVKRVVVLGCGAWGTATVKLVADNVMSSKEFHEEVYWYVRDEDYNGRSLTTWINQEHINPKYLPTLDIPSNVSASSNIQKVVEEADIILVSYPSCYILWLVENVKKFIKDGAHFVSFCKGLILCPEENRIKLVSDVIREQTGKSCVVVIGATTAVEVAKQHFTEATIGSKNLTYAHEVKRLLQPATVVKVLNSRYFLVELDDPRGNESTKLKRSDNSNTVQFNAYAGMLEIVPVNESQLKGVLLSPPPGWPKSRCFTWIHYLTYLSAHNDYIRSFSST